MIEIRFHGRGGQGAVVASNILAAAFFAEGLFIQSFPSFGGERRGAPVAAFVRVDQSRIDLRSNIYTPDQVIVMDASLIKLMDVTSGLKPGGCVLINSSQRPERYDLPEKFGRATVDAGGIAVSHKLGPSTAPIVNTAILGAFARATGLVKLDSVLKAIGDEVPDQVEANQQAARQAYEQISMIQAGD